MATIGVSCAYVAKYTDNGDGTTAYEGGTRFAKMTEISAAIETSDDNNLFADNSVAESDKSFAGGTLTAGVDDIEAGASKLILGATEHKITVGEKEVTELVFDDNTLAPYLGFGSIIKKKKSGVYKYRALIFPKVQFAVPEDAATTQADTIEWQTPSLEATIMRDDTAAHAWKREATFDTEAEAVAYIKAILGEDAGTLGALTVTSAAGATTGKTAVTVSPAKASSNSYKYKAAASVTAPGYDADCSTGYTAWDGSTEITATTGQKLLVVEVTSGNKARASGIATVAAKA